MACRFDSRERFLLEDRDVPLIEKKKKEKKEKCELSRKEKVVIFIA